MNDSELAFQARMAKNCINYFADEAFAAVSKADDAYSAIRGQALCMQLIGACNAMNWTDVWDREACDFWLDTAVDWHCYCSEIRYKVYD